MTITLRYPEWGDCEHTYPDDWEFGGAVGGDPRTDSRWRPTTYIFMNRALAPVYVGSDPLCDHEAIEGTRKRVDSHFPSSKVYYIKAQRPDGREEMIYQDIEGALGGRTS